MFNDKLETLISVRWFYDIFINIHAYTKYFTTLSFTKRFVGIILFFRIV